MTDDSPQPRGDGSSSALDGCRGATILAAATFAELCERADTLATRNGQPTLLACRSSSGERLVLKLWRAGRRFSSARLRPHHERFRRALDELRRRGIAVPTYRAHGRIAGSDLRFICYEHLEGTSLRSLNGRFDGRLLATFVARLHELGVYCRGLNLGSVLLLADGTLALVDVQDTRFVRGPLSARMRERNLGILCSNPRDLADMVDGRWADLVLDYCRAARMTVAQAARMRERVRVQIERRDARRGGARRARRVRRGAARRVTARDAAQALEQLTAPTLRSP